MVEGGVGQDARFFQLIQQAIVEIQPLRVHLPTTVRKDTRPGDRKTVSL